jgi:lysophospholipase L1-like esterase
VPEVDPTSGTKRPKTVEKGSDPVLRVALALVALLSACAHHFLPAETGPPPPPSTATIPVAQRLEDRLPQDAIDNFNERHARYASQDGDLDLLFVGDSITQGWGGATDVWQRYYGSLKADQFGVGWDRTQHVLWRLKNGEGQHVRPRVVVLLIGTNNIGQNTDAEISQGVATVVAELRNDFPAARILVLGILPRGLPDDPSRPRIVTINGMISKLADGKRVFYLDIGPKFLDANGAIPPDVMADRLHPTVKGYEIWAEAMKDELAKVLKLE